MYRFVQALFSLKNDTDIFKRAMDVIMSLAKRQHSRFYLDDIVVNLRSSYGRNEDMRRVFSL